MKKAHKNIILSLLKNRSIRSEEDIKKLEPINTGLTNHDYIIYTRESKYFCKYAEPKKRVEYIPWKINNRLAVEAKAIGLVTKCVKNRIKIPKVIFYDNEHSVLCLEVIPEWSELLSDLLLSGKVPSNIGRKLGENLSCIHQTSLGIAKKALREKECLRKIRIPLTYKNISLSKQIQKTIDALSKELLLNEFCLVHTDYKPNNIFVDRDGEVRVVDFEFMHIWDPAPDCAFMIGIYLHYAVAKKEYTRKYVEAIEDFWENYKKNFTMAREKDFEVRVIKHAGIQLLARLDGKIKFPTSQNTTIRTLLKPLGEKMILGKIKKVKGIRKYLLQSIV